MGMIAILGASGLIGNALARDMQRRGLAVKALARRFTPAQRAALGVGAVETPLVTLPQDELARLLADCDIVVNTVGILQGAESEAVHHGFAAMLAALCAASQKLLVHVSIPGEAQDDKTLYSRSKRDGERAIAASGASYVILRPGFVIATPAYGGSALLRALAALPVNLPRRESTSRFTATAIGDLCETVAVLVTRWRGGSRQWAHTWDVMEQSPGTVGDIVAAFRAHHGGPKPLLTTPGFLLPPGALAGDAAACWAGSRRSAAPPWPRCGAAWRAIRKAGWPIPASCRCRRSRRWRPRPPACRKNGSPGFTCSRRWRWSAL